eukprot:NODE_1880_length_1269_cov_20.731967_g1556_i0.p1 GENE.NODE_1880_length_1269_cov_20.731967_g1556_i0~~NODE_1880_length_1269_cov_20.731967_g1556_i0.p1  ORF type:complete len:342 (+),score=62.41 NODE_1880_length_1269_cov_20.731967_g1556_i0:145-1170(+)
MAAPTSVELPDPQEISVTHSNSPALQYNNLSFGSGKLATLSRGDVIIVGIAPIEKGEAPTKAKLGLKNQNAASFAAIVPLWGSHGLVVSTKVGIQIWSVQEETLKIAAELQEADKDIYLSRGIASYQAGGKEFVVLGHSNGALNVFSVTETQCSHAFRICNHRELISHISTSTCGKALVSGDISGSVSIWSIQANGGLEPRMGVPTRGDLPTSFRLVNNKVLAIGFGSGHIRIYDVSPEQREGVQRVEIAAHCRSIVALDVAPGATDSLFYLASVGEDSIVMLWKVKDPLADNGAVSLAHHRVVPNTLLTGIAFNQDASMLVAAGYDNDKIMVIKLPDKLA